MKKLPREKNKLKKDEIKILKNFVCVKKKKLNLYYVKNKIKLLTKKHISTDYLKGYF